jgi:hypothetical protein
MKTLRCLIIAPFDASGKRVQDTIRRALEEIGVNVARIDDLQAGALLARAITEAIDSSDFIVVDVSRHNPNVLYELGYAHGIKKPTILIASDDAHKLPTDLMGYLYIAYDKSNLRKLQEQITRAAMRFIEKEGI